MILAKRPRSDKFLRVFDLNLCPLVVQWIKMKLSNIKSKLYLLYVWIRFFDKMTVSKDLRNFF